MLAIESGDRPELLLAATKLNKGSLLRNSGLRGIEAKGAGEIPRGDEAGLNPLLALAQAPAAPPIAGSTASRAQTP